MAKGNTQTPEGPRGPSSIPIPKSRRGLKSFFADVSREMKKVNWPSRAETMRLTGVVLGVCVLMAILLTGMSYIADTFVGLLTHTGGKA